MVKIYENVSEITEKIISGNKLPSGTWFILKDEIAFNHPCNLKQKVWWVEKAYIGCYGLFLTEEKAIEYVEMMEKEKK
jgi:hypothetical protein